MKVLIIIPSDVLGGAEQYLKILAKEFARRKYFVYVCFLKKKTKGSWDDMTGDFIHLEYSLANRELSGAFSLLKKIFSIKNRKFDYAFTSHVHCSSYLGLLRKLKLIDVDKHIARESTSVFKRFSGNKLLIFKIMYKLGYPQVDLLICQTEYMRNQLIEALPWLNKKIKIRTIPNPVDLENMIEQSKSLNPFTLKQPYIISAGRLIPEKGFDILIKAFSKISSDYPQINLVILGEGNERSVLEKLILDLELQDKIFLPGFHSNVYPIFKEAELCVVSSRIEGFPNVLLQMMSQNAKVVSTKCAGGIESINGVFTCETENIDRLADAMRECLSVSTDYFRDVFDVELKKRSISDFIYTIENILMNE